MRRKTFIHSMVVACVVLFMAASAWATQPKYVFFFLGDGMSSSQIQATEAYLTTINGGVATEAVDLLKPKNRLNMSKLDVAGMQTTYDAHALMTDSASSATAFACGLKTLSGVIGMDDTKTYSYKSIAQLAHEAGMKVGVLSSVSLDHATPAAYYADVVNRGYMNNIATQLAESGYEFFGGGGLVAPTGAARGGDTENDVWTLLKENGYTVLKERDAILNLMDDPKDKVVCINPVLPSSSAMPYAIDKPAENLSLAEMTEVAIENLYSDRRGHGWRRNRNRDRGFFIMVEGGKVDWACHANDAVAAMGDMLDFDDAIGVALDFYKKHRNETLIVVTGDHETGGMTIGHATTAYTAHYDKLVGQVSSFENFASQYWANFKSANEDACPSADINEDMKRLMYRQFGLDFDSLNDYQKEKLEDAYDKSLCGSNDNSGAENTFLYGSYEPIIVTITHILNENASIGWTSYSHTGVPVPIFAQGRYAELFAGFYDNTDIAKKLAKAMHLGTMPVEK